MSTWTYINDMDTVAIGIVADYINEHLDKSDGEVYFEVYVVWKCKTLQNWKFLISSSLNGRTLSAVFSSEVSSSSMPTTPAVSDSSKAIASMASAASSPLSAG